MAEEQNNQDIAVAFVQSTANLVSSICTPAIIQVKQQMVDILNNYKSTIDELKNKIEKLENPKNTVLSNGKEVEGNIIPLIAVSYKVNKKKGYITYFTDITNIAADNNYTSIIIPPSDNKDVRAYITSNEPEFIDGNLVVTYRSTDRYNTIPYEEGDLVGKLIFVK